MTYKRLEETTFTWPAIKDGLMSLNHAQFEALFTGLDWRKVKVSTAEQNSATVASVLWSAPIVIHHSGEAQADQSAIQ